MKINTAQVPQDGLYLEEEADPVKLELETDLIKFRSPLRIKAKVYRITNVLTVDLNISAVLIGSCSRCLEEFEWQMNKDTKLNLPISSDEIFIDLTEPVREEVILDYPIKPLCRQDCRGLCVKCGKNKNEGGCNCGST